MPEHNTRQIAIECLEEAVSRLTQGQATLTQNHASLAQAQTTMNIKMDSILDHLVALTINPSSPKSPVIPSSTQPSKPHMKLDIPHFNGQDPVGRIFKI